MERDRYSRRKFLSLGTAAAVTAFTGTKRGQIVSRSSSIPDILPTQPVIVPEVVKEGPTEFKAKYFLTVPEIANGEIQPLKPEYVRSTPYIATKPEWSIEFLNKDTAPVTRVQTTKPLIAITIDDGFAKDSLRSILNTAIRKEITYTDFMKGLQREMYPDFVQEMIDSLRTELGSHTELHRDGRNGPIPGIPPTRAQLTEDITAPERFMNTFGQTTRPYLRPPGGAYSEWTLAVSADAGFRSINWSASADYGTTTDVRSLVPGDIVLMHYRDESAAQFPEWIDAVRAQGLEPTALSNLFAQEGK